MPRPTKTKEWPNSLNAINIALRENDLVQHYETNDKGKIRTNKRGWKGWTATVILGTFEQNNGFIEVPKGVQTYECDILDKGDISTIPHLNEKVTVIIHEEAKNI